ncbi:hypothetical protein ACOMHN_046406 [Nucella lapillus]
MDILMYIIQKLPHGHHPDFLYIGSSVNLRHRWSNHKSDCKLRKGHKCHVAQHFLDKQHPVDPQFTCLQIFAIEAVHKKENLGKRETWWQVKGEPFEPEDLSINTFMTG